MPRKSKRDENDLEWLEQTEVEELLKLGRIVDSQIRLSPFRHLPGSRTGMSSSASTAATNQYIEDLKRKIEIGDENELSSDDDNNYSNNKHNKRRTRNTRKNGSKKTTKSKSASKKMTESKIKEDADSKEMEWGMEEMDLINLHQESSELFAKLHCMMLGEYAGSSKSVILVGSHGFGKTSLLQKCLFDLKKKHGESSFVTVYLNPFLLNNDIEAMFQIVKQLHSQNMIMDPIHSQLSQISDDKDDIGTKTSFVENLDYLVKQLKKVGKRDETDQNKKNENNDRSSRKPIFVVLDSFELFAHRHKQTLLYTLFDLMQQTDSLFHLIGLCNVNNIDQCLEKRIRSRFLNEKIYVPSVSYYSGNKSKLIRKIIYNSLLICDTDDESDSNVLFNNYNDWLECNILQTKKFEDYIDRRCQCGIAPTKLLSMCAIIKCFCFHNIFLNDMIKSFPSSWNIDQLLDEIDQSLFYSNPIYMIVTDLSINQVLVLIIACKLDMSHIKQFNFETIYSKLKHLTNDNGANGQSRRRGAQKKQNPSNSKNSASLLGNSAMIHSNSKLVYLKAFEFLINVGIFVQSGHDNTSSRDSLYSKNIFSNVNETLKRNAKRLSQQKSNSNNENRLLLNQNTGNNYHNLGLNNKIGISCNDYTNDHIFDLNFQKVRLNDQIMFEGSSRIVDYVRKNVKQCPTWIKQWLLKDNASIQT